MRSNKALFPSMERQEMRSALEAVRISSGLIAFYPPPLRQPQPYVILLDGAGGMLKRLDLRAAKYLAQPKRPDHDAVVEVKQRFE